MEGVLVSMGLQPITSSSSAEITSCSVNLAIRSATGTVLGDSMARILAEPRFFHQVEAANTFQKVYCTILCTLHWTL